MHDHIHIARLVGVDKFSVDAGHTFLADMLFDHDEKMILPSFWGSTGIMLVVGAVLYTVFLLFSGATLMQGVLCLWLFLKWSSTGMR